MTSPAARPMKPSGLGWAGEIPAEWDVAKICLIARLESGHTPSRQHPEYWVPGECTVPWFSLADVWQLREGVQEYLGDTSEKISSKGLANSAARLLPAGTVVLSRTASIGFTGIMPKPMATTQDFANWIPGDRVTSEYLLYALRAMREEFQRAMMGSTHQTIYMPDIRRLAIPVPERREQDHIVDRLRSRLPKIDALIAKKERLVALLAEKRQALITQAVTKGLNPDVVRKESWVEAVGKVSAHWRVVRLKNLSEFTTSGSRGWGAFYSDDGPRFVRIGDISGRSIDIDVAAVQRVQPPNSAEFHRTRIFPGDLLVSITASIGDVAVAPHDLGEAYVSQHVSLTRPRAAVHPRWLGYAVTASISQHQLRAGMYGGTKLGLSLNDIRELWLVVPPIEEQRCISYFLDSEMGRIEGALAMLDTSLLRLREYRQALITTAVTGKLDLRAEAS